MAAEPETEEARQARIQAAIARGDAPIKPQYLLVWPPKRPAPVAAPVVAAAENAVAEESKATEDSKAAEDSKAKEDAKSAEDAKATEEPPSKRQKKKGGQNKNKDRQQNQNAARELGKKQVCARLAYLNKCDGGFNGIGCFFRHDIAAALADKLEPIGQACPVLKATGVCPAGLNCRFEGHIVDGKNVDRDGKPVTPESDWVKNCPGIGHGFGEINVIADDMKNVLRKRLNDFALSRQVVKTWEQHKQGEPFVGALAEVERKPLDFSGKTILAPLTTVGNLPYRRLCVKLGCDVTCGEMALGSSILEGKKSELALLRRHESEKFFGVQIAGGDVKEMTMLSEFVNENVSCDFVDINAACPLEDVHRRGAGSRLMCRGKFLEGMVRCMTAVLKVPLTVKLRTAHFEDSKNKEFDGRTAHQLIPNLEEWGASAMWLHGRTARQRYTKLADWDYVSECARRRTRAIPLMGLGDVLSWEDAEKHCKEHGVDNVMIARGGLIKPWLFTEMKERRTWDISATERLDLMRDYANYGLEHWGSDARGVENTRRFLLEWLSFSCRYIPVGLLEVQPQHMNWRPRPYVGRSDLETRLSSNNPKDWVDITEMLLGKVPEGFTFVPKHKSSAYEPVAALPTKTEPSEE